MGFKKGDKVRFVNDIDYSDMDMTLNKVYTVVRDQEMGFSSVRVITDEGKEYGLYAYRFELVKDDKPALPTLKPGMRVVLQAGYEGVVVRNSKDELAISLGGTWSRFYFGETGRFLRDYNIVEVYEAPAFCDALRLDKRGALVWQTEDAAKAASIKAADDAVAEAQAALHAAQAARAAL